MIGGGFGARGEVEHSNQNDANRRIVSIRTARSMSVALNIITLAVYLGIFLYWWFVLIVTYTPDRSASSFAQWWGRTSFVASTWGRAMGRTWPLWLIPLSLEWIAPQWILYRHNLRPKLYNENWPPPSAQMDPNTSGFVTADNWDERAGIGVLERDEPQAQLVTLEIIQGDKRRYLTDIEITPGLQRFCRGVLDGSVTFSEGGAAGCEWKPKAAFIDLRDKMLKRDMIAWKNQGNTRSGYHIRPVARRALAELAALPCPGG